MVALIATRWVCAWVRQRRPKVDATDVDRVRYLRAQGICASSRRGVEEVIRSPDMCLSSHHLTPTHELRHGIVFVLHRSLVDRHCALESTKKRMGSLRVLRHSRLQHARRSRQLCANFDDALMLVSGDRISGACLCVFPLSVHCYLTCL